MLVLAGAGTGKTRVITVRMAYLLHQGHAPERLFAVTFTNKAATEMRERVARLVGKEKATGLTIGTFHSFCARVLRKQGRRIDLPPRFSICDQADQIAALKNVLRDILAAETMRPRDILARISLLKNKLVSAEQYLDGAAVDDRDEFFGQVYLRYEQHLRRTHTLDFDDLLLRMVDLLRTDPPLKDRYRYLMVDEYQDTNGPQYEIVRQLAEKRKNLCVVGDDDQSIYGWRGADVKKILSFERDFPSAAVIRLETNYRSTDEILVAANSVIDHNIGRHAKKLRSAYGRGEAVRIVPVQDEELEARGIVEEIVQEVRKPQGLTFADCAILFRAANQSRAFEAELRARNVDYTIVGGQSFFDRKEIRDVLAYLKVLVNPRDDVSLLRVVNCPPRGIGKTTLDRVVDNAAQMNCGIQEAFFRTPLPSGAGTALRFLQSKLEQARRTTGSIVRRIECMLELVDYQAEVNRCYREPRQREQRWSGVQEVLNFAENYERRAKNATLPQFLERLTLSETEDRTSDEEEKQAGNAVRLMTLHAAKGLEFRRVYLVGIEEGTLPHERSVADDTIEEERRLMYVGITRAQRNLTISFAKQRAKHGHRVRCMPSRFLYEIKGEAPPDDWVPAGQKAPAPAKPKSPRSRVRRAPPPA